MKSSTEKLLKVLESKIDKIVEKRVQKLLPMLVEHEVNRLLREETQKQKQPTVETASQPVSKSEPLPFEKGNIMESLKSMVGGDVGEYRSMNYTTQTGIPGYPAQNTPMTTMEGKPVDTSNPAVAGVLNVMNGNLGDTFKKMDKLAKQRGGFKR